MAKRYEIAELETAMSAFESTAVPGGGGYLVCLQACVQWENCFRKHERKLSKKMAHKFKQRAVAALDAAMKP